MSATQRKMILMFTDVTGSTDLFEHLGNEEAMYAVERCLARMKRSVSGYRGKMVQIVGDEMLATYETAEEACQAAIDMQQRIADLPPISGLKLTIRIGLHAGQVTENDNKLSGEAVINTARIAGIAYRDQILCSSALVAELPEDSAVRPRLAAASNATDAFMAAAMNSIVSVGLTSNPDTAPEFEASLKLFSIHWTPHETGGWSHSILDLLGSQPSECLRVRYQGKSFLLDDKMPALTLGRDHGNELVIEDRRASRQHARIEKRQDGYFLVDSSTNGCYVRIGREEKMIRHQEFLLKGKGKICFGHSGKDANADTADFEHL
ncbi:MAG: adenylate/guanylate cyclase domain-containing protein [Azonexus sp.]|jgi:hypothetical protein|nr:adenylate/guanylate cyclase domain-containing protein [Azonexus sp.]